jgi:hypothetical protein
VTSPKAAQSKAEPKIVEPKIKEAAEKTGILIRQLQSRLNGAGDDEREGPLMRELQSRMRAGDQKAGLLIRELQTARKSTVLPEVVDESPEEMEKQMQAYFERADSRPERITQSLHDLRQRVVDEAADRILRDWGLVSDDDDRIENEVIDRIVDRVIERLMSGEHKR